MRQYGPQAISCALVAWCLAATSHAALAQVDATATRPQSRAHADPTLTYGNPDAPLAIEVSDTARRGAATFAHATLRPLVDRFPRLVSLRWTIVSRGTLEDDRAASALLEAAAQGQAWCLVEAIGAAPAFGEDGGDQLDVATLLAAAERCGLQLARFAHAITHRTYASVAPRPDAEPRGATQRLSINGTPVTRNLIPEMTERVERLALRRSANPPAAMARAPLIGRSRGSYERPALNPTSPPRERVTDVPRGDAPWGGYVLVEHAQPTWSIDVYCVLDTICQGLLAELERLASPPRAGAIRARWTPLAAMGVGSSTANVLTQPARDAASATATAGTTDATVALTCAAQRGTSPPLLLQLAATGGGDVALCADNTAMRRALATTLAYTARAHRAGLRHDLAVVINGRVLAGGIAASSLREHLLGDTSTGVLERLPPWLR